MYIDPISNLPIKQDKKKYDTLDEAEIARLSLEQRELDPNCVFDGDIFQMTVEQFLSICSSN